jgi:hypothetical protein
MCDTERAWLAPANPMSPHLNLQPAVATGRTVSAGPWGLVVQTSARQNVKQRYRGCGYPSARGRPQLFCADCERDHTARYCPRSNLQFTGWHKRFQYPGFARPLALYSADASSFLAATPRSQPAPGPECSLIGLSEPVAVAPRLGRLLNHPKHPDERGGQADHYTQEQQCQSGGREHANVREPVARLANASRVPADDKRQLRC